jgi:probable selenium-dependent hydroxylase accessory protein YqeC
MQEGGRKKMGLAASLGLGAREHIALVGAGGKTTLMLSLAKELACSGRGVIATTTTKVRKNEATVMTCVETDFTAPDWQETLRRRVLEKGLIFVIQGHLVQDKMVGIGPEAADRLYFRAIADYVIAEADGAAGRPLKAPGDHEPVIPSAATLVVAVTGLDALGKPLNEETVFRAGRFEEITGVSMGTPLKPDQLRPLFSSNDGLFKGTPASARQVVFLNRSDLVGEAEPGSDLAGILLNDPESGIERVVAGSLRKKSYLVYR